MPRLKVLSGKDVVKRFSRFGFTIASQKGSYVKLKRILPDGTRQILTIPLHEELDKETLKVTYRQALRYIPKEELKTYFYD